MKDYNVRRHYETKHQSYHRIPVPNEHRRSSKWQLACKLNKIQENTTTASYEVAKLIAQHGKAFSDGDSIKQCLIKVTEIMCRILTR